MTGTELLVLMVAGLSLVGGIIAASRFRFLLAFVILAIGFAVLVQAAATGVGA